MIKKILLERINFYENELKKSIINGNKDFVIKQILNELYFIKNKGEK